MSRVKLNLNKHSHCAKALFITKSLCVHRPLHVSRDTLTAMSKFGPPCQTLARLSKCKFVRVHFLTSLPFFITKVLITIKSFYNCSFQKWLELDGHAGGWDISSTVLGAIHSPVETPGGVAWQSLWDSRRPSWFARPRGCRP